MCKPTLLLNLLWQIMEIVCERAFIKKFAWKVADGVAIHSKLAILVQGDGWLIMVDVSRLYYIA